jgi:hypothetical protein
VLALGRTLLPAGAPTLLIRVDPARIRDGFPAVVIHTGEHNLTKYAARAIHLHGPSTLGETGRSDFTIGIRTAAAIEVIA